MEHTCKNFRPILKLFKLHLQLNLIKNKEMNTKSYNSIKIDALIQVVLSPPIYTNLSFFLLSECVHDELKTDNVTCV